MQLDWKYSLRQAEADGLPDPFVLYGGAKGGGKSFWLVRWAFMQLLNNPGNKGFLGRKRGVDFNNTTLETWRKAIPGDLYRINEQKKKIFVECCKGIIDYGGMDKEEDINKFNSAEYGFAGIDQAEEISRDDFAMIRGTLRHSLTNGRKPKFQIRLTANPAQCWLKDDFILAPKEGFKFIKALPSDNPFLAEGYIQNLKEAFQHRPDLLQAYLYGSWDEIAGSNVICQMAWVNKAQDLKPQGPARRRIVVCDPAHFGDDETVIYTFEESSVAHITDTEIVAHKSTMDTAGRLRAKKEALGANLISVDGIGIGAGVVDALNELNENVLEFKSSRRPTTESEAERYANLRAQIWFQGARKIFEGRVAVPKDDILKGQLSSITFEYMSNGRFKIESKDDIKTRLGKSPDRADAFMMGLYALELADKLGQDEDREASTDRVGQGTPAHTGTDNIYCYEEY